MSQSIDFSAVTDATFNGSAVEQINLNGAGVWTKPASVGLQAFYNTAGYQTGTLVGSAMWLHDISSTPVDLPEGSFLDQSHHQISILFYNGIIHLGYTNDLPINSVQAYSQAMADSIPVANKLEIVMSTLAGQGQFFNPWNSNTIAYRLTAMTSTSYASSPVAFYTLAKIESLATGIQPLGPSSYNQTFVETGTDSYGNTFSTTRYAEYTITNNTFYFRSNNRNPSTLTLNLASGDLTGWGNAGNPAYSSKQLRVV